VLVAYDTELFRPACVLVAAALGADSRAASAFDTKYWLLAPTPGMAVFNTTPEQLTQLVAITEERARV
jgi:hypothetical protein